jgi:hypothetical protein
MGSTSGQLRERGTDDRRVVLAIDEDQRSSISLSADSGGLLLVRAQRALREGSSTNVSASRPVSWGRSGAENSGSNSR